MKRIHLTKEEKAILNRFARRNIDCPEGMEHGHFLYVVFQLKKKKLVIARIVNNKILDGKVSDVGRYYLTVNPTLKNPIPWDYILYSGLAVLLLISAATNIIRICQAI